DVVRGASLHPPSHYVDRFYVDTVVFDSAALRLLVETMGDDRVVLGSDYPYPLGERPAGAVVRGANFLSEGQRGKLLSRNPLRFLRGREVPSPALGSVRESEVATGG